jgi:WD40 repeat protein
VRARTTAGTYSSCFAFSPDGKRMATGHTDGTILLWDVDLPAASEVRLDTKEVETLWADLHDADAAKAWRAAWRPRPMMRCRFSAFTSSRSPRCRPMLPPPCWPT